MPHDHPAPEPGATPDGRRGISVGAIAMAGGLAAGYGAFAWIAARYLYPAKPNQRAWMLVREVARIKTGEAVAYRTPSGATVNIARRGAAGAASDFIALSSVCPHLGCQVHWEGPKNRFYCPCHGGVFTPEGKAIEGPPADAGQSLSGYPLKVENGLLYIEVELGDALAKGEVLDAPPPGPPGPGHDPCLYRSFPEGGKGRPA